MLQLLSVRASSLGLLVVVFAGFLSSQQSSLGGFLFEELKIGF